MSGGLAPSKSTVYVSNLPFSLTNNDLHKVFEKYGRVIKVTIMRDKDTRKSKGVAFVLYLSKDDSLACVKALNGTTMFDRTLKCSLAQDNGRASDYIRRKNYVDKSRCYECGEEGHLSYACPMNTLGERKPPPKKKRKRGERGEGGLYDSDSDEDKDEETLDAAIRYQREKMEEEEYRLRVVTGNYSMGNNSGKEDASKKIKPSGYFSDEEDVDEG